MSLLGMVWQNIRGGAFRSVVIAACAMLVTGMTLGVFMVLRSAQFQLEQSLNRMGADIMVVAWGNTNQYIRGAHLISEPSESWIPNIIIDRIKQIPGIAKVSPQLYLTTLKASPLASGADVVVVGLDPQTDITVHPWLSDPQASNLLPGEVWVGSDLALQPGSSLDLYGLPLIVRGQLLSTRTELDHAIFMDLDTAQELADRSNQIENNSIKIVPGTSSVLMVRVAPDQDPYQVSVKIIEKVSMVRPLESENFFQVERSQMLGLQINLIGLMTLIWLLAIIFTGLVFSITVNERRRQIGVLRALGATRQFIFRLFLVEGGLLTVLGGLAGIGFASLVLFVLQNRATQVVGIAIQLPGTLEWLGASLLVIVFVLVSVLVAAMFPVFQFTSLEPAVTMRE